MREREEKGKVLYTSVFLSFVRSGGAQVHFFPFRVFTSVKQ